MITTEPITPTRSKRRWLWPVVAVTLFFLGIALGGAGGGSAEVDTRTVTETETVTEIVETVPDVCLAALDDADGLNAISADFAGITATALTLASEGLTAAAYFDVAELERVNAEMLAIPDQIDALTVQINDSTYAVNRDACRTTS